MAIADREAADREGADSGSAGGRGRGDEGRSPTSVPSRYYLAAFAGRRPVSGQDRTDRDRHDHPGANPEYPAGEPQAADQQRQTDGRQPGHVAAICRAYGIVLRPTGGSSEETGPLGCTVRSAG